MLTACEANKATKDRLDQVAKEFIINVVSDAVREAVEHGVFTATIEIVDPLAGRAAERIAEILRDEYHFNVELTLSSFDSPCWINISWEANNESTN